MQKRICVLKVGLKMVTNIAQENYVVLKILSELGYQVDCYTADSKFGTYEIDNVNFYDFPEFYKKPDNYYHSMFIINGVISFYGGLMEPHCGETIKIINAYKGDKLYYLLFDEILPLKQYWKPFEKKQAKYNWTNQYTQKEIEITRDDITVITLIEDLEYAKTLVNKQGIKFKDVKYFPLSKLHIIVEEQDQIPFTPTREYDLTYGGTFRRGGRELKMIEYYFDHKEDIKVEMFGRVKQKHFNEKRIKDLRLPNFYKSVPADKFMSQLAKAYSTIVIIDKNCEGKRLTPRVYQSIFSNVITFIDEAYDPKHNIYSKHIDELKQLYITSKEQIYPILDKIKADPEYFKHLCELQIDCIRISDPQFLEDFHDLFR